MIIKELFYILLVVYSFFLLIEKHKNSQKYLVDGYKEITPEVFGIKPIETCTDEEACEE